MDTKIAIGLPTNRGVKPETAISLFNLVKSKHDFHFIISTHGYNTAENRNYIVAQAIQNNCTHLLLTDDDMIYPADSLDRLLAHKKDIVGAVYNVRNLEGDGQKEVIEYLDGKSDGLFECKALGGGLLLIDLKIISKMKSPLFWYKLHSTGMIEMSNDWWFCEKAREVGFKVFCDPTLSVKHIGDREY